MRIFWPQYMGSFLGIVEENELSIDRNLGDRVV